MLPALTHMLFDRLIEAFPANRPYGRADIRGNPMPGPVAHYLEHLLEAKLRNASQVNVFEAAWVDPYVREVMEARMRYVESMVRHQAIPAPEWAGTLGEACRETMAFLVRPAPTLVERVCGESEEPASVDAVLTALGFFPVHRSFPGIIEACFEEQGTARFARERLLRLVRRIDAQIAAGFSPGEWREAIDPLVHLLRAAGADAMPIPILDAFLHEKGAEGPACQLERLGKPDGSIPFEQLDVLFTAEMDAVPHPEAEHVRPQERPAESYGGPLPLWKRFERGGVGASREVEPSHSAGGNAQPEPLWKRFRKASLPARSVSAVPSAMGATHEAHATHATNARDLVDADPGLAGLSSLEHTVLGPRGARSRDLFVQHLFAGRQDEYQATLNRLAHASSWAEASRIIANDVFVKHGINIYSDPAVAFTDAAEARYRG